MFSAKGKFLSAIFMMVLASLYAVPAYASACPTLVHQYEFNGNLTDSVGSIALINNGGILNPTSLSFGRNQGPTLEAEAGLAGDYSIGMRFSLSQENYWRKVIDFKNRTSDVGQYLAATTLSFQYFYPYLGGSTYFPATATVDVVFTRDGTSGLYTMYLNGSPDGSFTDSGGAAIASLVGSTAIFHFFRDDFATGQFEASAGTVEEIRIWDGPLTAAQASDAFGPGGVDTDGDAVPDLCDACPLDSANDADGDGFCADVDSCPGGDDSINTDGDGLPDFCDICPLDVENDADSDGICESSDNCPTIANNNQANLDGDGLGDVCDDDIDGDGVLNTEDNCPFDVNTDQADLDGDGAGDVCDDDIDGDGVLDAVDACVPSPVGAVVNTTGCAISELCPCSHPNGADLWKNHGAYVSCVARAANDFLAAGLITGTEHGLIVSAAGQSTCGQKNK